MKVEEIKLALEKNRETHVQFALIDDLKSVITKGEKTYSTINKTTKVLDQLEKDLIKNRDILKGIKSEATNQLNQIETLMAKIELDAKNLGIDVKSIKTWSDARNLWGYFHIEVKVIDEYLKPI